MRIKECGSCNFYLPPEVYIKNGNITIGCCGLIVGSQKINGITNKKWVCENWAKKEYATVD